MDEQQHSLLSVQVTLTEYDTSHEFNDAAVLSRDVWRELGLPERLNQSIAVSIQPPPNYSSAYPIRCWARLSELSSYGENIVTIPKGFAWPSPSSHETKYWTVSVINPVKLTYAFVKFHEASDYEEAEERREAFEQWIMKGKRIIGSSQVYELPPGVLGKDPCTFSIVLCEPCRIGFLDPQSTKVLLSKSVDGEPRSISSDTDELDDDDDLVIDERFLEGSVLGSGPSSYLSNGSGRNQTEKSLDVHLRLIINDNLFFADSNSLYLGVNDLNSLGVLSGDWAIASVSEDGQPRLLRVYLQESIKISPGTCIASLALAHNLYAGVLVNSPTVTLRAVNREAASFPTATSVTIARAASPLVTRRTFDTAITEALKDILSSKPRLVAKGDLICCHVNLNQAEISPQPSEDLVLYRSNGYRAPHTNLVFFQVKQFEIPSRTEQGSTIHRQVQAWLDPRQSRVVEDGMINVPAPRAIVDSGVDGLTGVGANAATMSGTFETQLRVLVMSALHGMTHSLYLDDPVLLKGASGAGIFTSVTKVAESMGMHVQEINSYEMVGESNIHTIAAVTARAEATVAYGPCLVVLRHLEGLSNASQGGNTDDESSIGYMLDRCLGDVRRQAREANKLIIVVGIVEYATKLPNSVLALFKNEIVAEAPSEQQRLSLFSSLVQDVDVTPEVSSTNLATRSAGLIANDLVDMVERAEVWGTQNSLPDFRSDKLASAALDVAWNISSAAFENALNQVRKSYSESIGAPKIPNVTWDDVGGLATVKNEVLDTIQLPLDHPELFIGGVKKRSGILFYGPPGTGKTLVAKAVATSCSLNFFSVKGPELLNMYIGESEANVRRIFQRARDARPCVIFFDELDSVAPKRGNQGDSGGVMDRIVSQLLAELDGIAGAGSADVFVIGATNRPDLLDPALLRPGRFDRMLYLGLSETHDQQLQLLQALTRKFRLAPDLDLQSIAQKCPFTLTGADFYALCSDALLRAMTRQTEDIDARINQWNADPQPGHPNPMTVQYYLTELAKAEDLIVQVSVADFEQALSNLTPSVSEAELGHYASVQAQYTRPAS